MLFFVSFLQQILPIHLLYFEAIINSMYDVSNNSAPKDFCDKFIKTSLIHSYNTRAASCSKQHSNHYNRKHPSIFCSRPSQKGSGSIPALTSQSTLHAFLQRVNAM